YHPTIGSRPIPDPAQRSLLAPGDDTARTPFRGVRRTIANRLRESVNTAVHFTVVDEADVTALDDYRRQVTEQTGVKLSLLPFVAAAVCRSLTGRFGALNAIVDDQNEEIVQHAAVHLGIATDTDSGLMVPVIRDADRMDPVTLAQQIAQTAAAARDRSIPRDRLMGSTFTISNVGSHAGKFATPVINYPEVAILAVGKAYDAVIVRDGQPAIGKLLPLSLACDHRVVDGATAALALAEIVQSLQDPASIA
ncbi:MAG: 2-oxo acid dehydrogenase subunit E2, partial [Planctomycetota bacterium]